jgi:hypothetical protein
MINVIIPNEEYSNVDDAGKKALIGTALAGAVAIAPSLLQRQRPLSQLEQVCGKKPKLGRRKKEAWQDCVNRSLPKPQTQQPQSQTPPKKDNKIFYIVGGSILGLGLIGLLIYKFKK